VGSTVKRLAAACMALTLSSLIQAAEPKAEDERALALALYESTMRAAVAHRGVTVCRQLLVGIAERDWIRGEVVDVQGHLVAVRIEDSGRFPHILKGIPIVPGAVLWNTPTAWTPCV
jgi:hypothetical protein